MFFIIKVAAGTLLIMIGLILIMLFFQEKEIDLGNSRRGYKELEKAIISTQSAIDLAKPHLEYSYELRRKMRGETKINPNRESLIWVSSKGEWFYITKDDYPSYSPGYYTHFAVKVNTQTGKVIPPDQSE